MKIPKMITNILNRYEKYGLKYTFDYITIQFLFFFNYTKIIMIMTKREINCIEKYLKSSDTMIEWGAGGSTLYFSKKTKFYVSIEDSKVWYKRVLKAINKEPDLKKKVVILNIKSNEARSFPSKRSEFIDYIEIVKKLNHKWDKVLIDGRARVYCGKEVKPYLKKDSIIFLHDFQRSKYESLFEYYELIESVDKLAVLKLIDQRSN